MSLQKEKTEGLTPEEAVEQAKLRENILRVIVVLFVTTLKESKLWMKKEMM